MENSLAMLFVSCNAQKHLSNNSFMLLYQNIKPQSLVTSHRDARQKTGSTVITHYIMEGRLTVMCSLMCKLSFSTWKTIAELFCSLSL